MEKEIYLLKEENKKLTMQLYEAEERISSISVDITDKCFKACVNRIRSISRRDKSKYSILIDDSPALNLFDQLCIIYNRGGVGDEEYYPGLTKYIDDTCDIVISEVATSNEEYILSYEFSDKSHIDLFSEVRNKLTHYLGEHSNQRIRKFFDE